ncbi:Pkinase-domain-containing protein [Cucurbitaria berberidis CBS 394.84]|uniref:non-specific serine/threonine protein kinase n=1 Tax=Cucurbitaria berberidis CBS 394.84 TaxID=1168544 RepID=A0A9P4L3E6_9PLEO|nr:Pkinase-domain-containing protein [Cucurbitaria berberidis CBS 394.84]KAF1840217.1 Pkinase-domain-containing protein [Cucurbitaria berberidis CBS 394.84]
MPAVATHAPPLAISFDEASLSHRLQRRDSRRVEYQFPIEEEDESTGTASEPAEPLTPTSHTSEGTSSFSHSFPHATTNDMLPKPLPQEAPSPATFSTQSEPNTQASHQVELQSSPERVGLGKRVGSFVRSRLHRSHSNKDGPSQAEVPNAPSPSRLSNPKVETNTYIVKTGVDGPAEVSTPAVHIPKQSRRLSSFSLTRRSDRSSHANSPPSGSPMSTLSNAKKGSEKRPGLGKKPSSPTSHSSMERPRPGITWAGPDTTKSPRKHGWSRRRSASMEQIPRLDEGDEKPTAGMLATFSKPAVEGAGLKVRRLSVNLPDDFIIDWCDLDKEFKSSSLMPGKRGRILGKGATSEVRIMARRGALSKDEELVAVKEFRARDKDETEEDYVLKIKSEYSIAKSLHHPNIVETVRLCTNRQRWNHVMEFCTYGEIYSLVERKLFAGGVEGFYSRDDRLCFFKQLLRGVDFLHSHGIAHRDIKLENLLLNKDGHLKISDFGVAEVFSGEHPGLRASGGECGKNMGALRLSAPGICGSLPYIAPEVLEKNHSYDPRPLDIWSCAIVYLTMTFGGCPWQAAKTEFEYYARFKKGWNQWLEEHPDGQIFEGPDGHPKCGKLFSLIEPPSIKRLILKMLHPIPSKRIMIPDVMKTACIKNIACCCPETYDDPKVCFDASKASSAKVAATKKFLHHHIPPKPENKVGKAFTHRFDMGER